MNGTAMNMGTLRGFQRNHNNCFMETKLEENKLGESGRTNEKALRVEQESRGDMMT